MRNKWLENNITPKVDFKCPIYLQWLKEIWHVEIEEEARHLWPGQYTISGWYQHEKDLYEKYEEEWEKRRDEAWKKKHEGKQYSIIDTLNLYGEDYFNWNVSTPSWCLHRDGTWHKMLVEWDDRRDGLDRSEYPGIYTYEKACLTLGKFNNLPPKFVGYEKHLDDFVQNYDYTK